MSRLPVVNLIDSPYRDRVTFPIDPAKIKGLVESIHQTGFWDNILCRFKSNTTKGGTLLKGPEEVEAYVNAPDFDPSTETFELAYGHHRLDAIKVIKMLEVDIPVKYLVNETMLRIMSNENKAGWGSSITAKLETVRQVKNTMELQLDSYDDHKDYTAAGLSFFDYNSFEKARSYGIGYRKVQQFLGKEWSVSDVRIPMAIMECLDKGWFEQTDLKPVPSLGLMEIACSTMAAVYDGAEIRQTTDVPVLVDGKPVMEGDKAKTKKEMASVNYPAPDWPEYYKQKAVEKILWLVSIPADELDKDGKVKKTFTEARATVARMKSIRKALLTNKAYPGGKGTAAFDVNKKVKEEFFEKLDGDFEDQESRDKAYEELSGTIMTHFLSVEGFKDWSGFEAMLDSIAKYIEKVKLMPEKAPDTLDQSDMDGGEGDGYTPSEVFQEENEEKSNVIQGLFETDKDLESGADLGLAPGKAVNGMMIALTGVDTGCHRLMECQADIDMTKEEKFEEIMTTALKNLCSTYAALVGRDNLNTLVSEVMIATKE